MENGSAERIKAIVGLADRPESFISASRLTDARDFAFTLLNVAVLALFVPLASLSIFYAAGLFWIGLRHVAPKRARAAVKAAGAVCLIVLLLFYESSAILLNAPLLGVAQAFLPEASAWLGPGVLVALGVSYCFARTIYALLDDTVGPYGFTRYYFFAPTFISGPIMPAADVLNQRLQLRMQFLRDGAARILYGVLKFVASCLLQLAVPISTAHHAAAAIDHYPTLWLWVTLFLCGVWLYLNFSAFTDMAIGAGLMVGFRIAENFANPFAATSLTDFWRRWHITLGDWLRTTIYNPVARHLMRRAGPNSLVVAIVPVIATMIICGLWHQTTLAFLIWGGFHGLGLAWHQGWRLLVRPRLGSEIVTARWYRGASWVVTHGFVSISWVFFFPASGASLGLHLRLLARLFS